MASVDNARTNSIRILPDSVARKIAAGEVIERPASVVRELIDNSIDAGASTISVELEEGGLSLIRVTDSGVGMPADDLERCYLSHATSKIRGSDDLLRIESLGFRGEALASIGAVSRLEISSRSVNGDGGRVVVEDGNVVEHGATRGVQGTSVDVRRLFYNLPARKRFLKRAATETAMVRQVVIEKALAYPQIEFKLTTDGAVRLMLPKQETLARIAMTHERLDTERLTEIRHDGVACRLASYVGDTTVIRRDRKMIQTFVNGRRISEYGFVQAVEYALGDLFHGGTFPVCLLFIDVPAEEVDFNVHPAKREAKFSRRDRIHHDIVTALRSNSLRPAGHLANSTSSAPETDPAPSRPLPFEVGDKHVRERPRPSASAERPERSARELPSKSPDPYRSVERFEPSARAPASSVPPGHVRNDLVYHGTLFGTYLIVERGNELFLVDQHAAHERIMYDSFRKRGTVQRLLVPIDFDVEGEQMETVRERITQAAELGIEIEERGSGRFRIYTLPESFSGSESVLIESLCGLELISGEFERDLYATMACKAAVRAGDHVDELTARELIHHVFGLSDPRCPHGRPLWIRTPREELDRKIGRC